MMKTLKVAGISLLGLIVVSILGLMIVQRVSDGPIGPLQGGPFSSGVRVTEPVTDWSFGVGRPMSFELEGYGTSRIAGYIMHDGVAYMTCDLGFMWNRFEGRQRLILNLIYLFKHWHEDAVEDGRALLRIDGRIYKAQFVKVEDPGLNEILRGKMEDLAREYFAPAEIGPRPTEPPNDVWFFRMDPRL